VVAGAWLWQSTPGARCRAAAVGFVPHGTAQTRFGSAPRLWPDVVDAHR